jgi:hypothetical protein
VTTGVVDEDPAHDLRRNTEEMRTILPVDAPLIDEPDVHLMNESRWRQRVVGPLVPELARGNPTKLRIDQWQHLIERSSIAATPIGEQHGDIARGSGWIFLQRLDWSY